ncbi:hypothetical protein [Xanthomonas campestris]|uniref:Uncharacterized protein n=1 Tax=Xanthomonas campestris pv. papavericola TaxID=487881 RepID=A0AAJ3CCI1_XANCA|nr:hypothetical protein [Xanthomonas campestris]MEC3886846.1 hypothetical protein [Xanthomonas campestris pv. papavericola]
MDYSVNKPHASGRVNFLDESVEPQPTPARSTQNSQTADRMPEGMPPMRPPRRHRHTSNASSARSTTSNLVTANAGLREARHQGEAGPSSRLPPKSPVASDKTFKTIRAKETSHIYKNVPNVVGIIDTLGPRWDVRLGPRDWGSELMVRCSDGLVRRYPTFERLPDANYLSQIAEGLIYSAPSDSVTRRFGGVEATNDHQQAFMVDGYAVSPIRIGSFDAYPIPNGKFMVLQPSFRDCTFACELMMRLDHHKISVDGNSGPMDKGRRRDMPEIASSLSANTGMEPVLLEYKNVSYKKSLMGSLHETRRDALRDLGKKINEMGSCIFSKGGHVLMLDGVREHRGKFYLSIREPFHGEAIEFKDTKDFFRDNNGVKDKVSFQAIFLKKP